VTRVVVRCDGSVTLGLGHVVRCLAVAEELAALGADVSFASRPDAVATAMVERAGFTVHGPEALAAADVALVDVRDDTSRAELDALRRRGTAVGVLDDGSDRRLAADVVFYPPVPGVERLEWEGFSGFVRTGWDWIPLRRGFSAPGVARAQRDVPRVLVACGGSDPVGLTLRAVRALELIELPLEPVLLIGAAFRHRAALDVLLSSAARPYDVRIDPSDPAATLADADVAIASFGMTAYELAALRVPAVHLCLTDDHAESAAALHRAGAARSLGRHDRTDDAVLAGVVSSLLAAPKPVPPLVDGRGAERIARQLLDLAVVREAA
jgi:spore coat polysaccharide biosynthesis predicted glycosyltransferase SpsG